MRGKIFFIVFVFMVGCASLGEKDQKKAEKKSDGYLMGMDVSQYQSTVDWDVVQNDGVSFVIVRATMGASGVDKNFKENWQQLKKDGFIRGAYHFFHGGHDAEKQAYLFVKTVNREKGDLPLIIDIEYYTENQKQSSEALIKRLRTVLDIIEKQTGVKPIIYTSPGFWNSKMDASFAAYPLWVAEYATKVKPTKGWDTNWTFWQHTEKGTMNGVKGFVDQNWFRGSLKDLKKLAHQ